MSNPFAIDELIGRGLIAGGEVHDRLASTSDHATALLTDNPSLPRPYVIQARQQTAGRGRRGNGWWSDAGSLLFTLILDHSSVKLPDSSRSCLSLLCGLALADGLEAVSGEDTRHRVRLKWPNDLFVGEQKLAGILVENVSCGPECDYLIGIGINLTTDTASAPPLIRDRITSWWEVAERVVDPTELLAEFLHRLADETTAHQTTPEQLPNRWRSRCLLEGRTVGVRQGESIVRGTCCGITPTGELRLIEHGVERLVGSGTVVEIEYSILRND